MSTNPTTARLSFSELRERLGLATVKTRKKHQKRKADVLNETSPALQLEGGEGTQTFTEIETEQPKRIKLSARDLLATLSRRRISITEIEFASSSSKDGGTYADVAVATLVRTRQGEERRSKVAVKKLRFVLSGDMTEEKHLRAFVNELRILDKLGHSNIVDITGFVEDTENHIAWLVFPWEENGNLREFLRSGKWELPERVSLIQDVAFGLKYLHTLQPPICHGDLKSLNILVNPVYSALITDFGSARELEANSTPPPAVSTSRVPSNEHLQFDLAASDTTLTLTGPEYSFRWAPPEVLNGGPLDLTSDIWALGWIAWEAITDSHPFEELNLESAVVMRIVEGKLPLLSDHRQLSQVRRLCSIMLSCWKSEPKERPSATECSRTLELIPAVIPLPKDGDQSPTHSAVLFLELGEIHRLQNRNEATKMFEQGLAIARSTTDQFLVARLSSQLAESRRMQHMYDEAETSYTEAMSIFESIGHDKGRADALLGLGQVQELRLNYVDAEASYTEAMTISGNIRDDIGRANALVAMGHLQRKRSNFVDAGASYTEAMSIFDSIGDDQSRAAISPIYASIGDDLGRANALLGLGLVQEKSSNYVDAEASFAESLVICKSTGYDLGRANALVAIGGLQQSRSNNVDAEASYTEAMSIFDSIGHDQSRAATLLWLGRTQRERSKYVEAEASYTQAMAIFASIGEDRGRAVALAELGDIQRLHSKYVDAEASYTQAMAIYGSIQHDRGRADALVGLGHVQQERSKYDEAEACYTQAMAIYTSIGDDKGRTKSSLGLGLIRWRQARYSEARVLANDAASISEQIRYYWGKKTSSMLLEDVLEDEGSSTDGSSTEPNLSPPASPDVTHAEDIVAAPLLAEVADTNTPDSVDLPQ